LTKKRGGSKTRAERCTVRVSGEGRLKKKTEQTAFVAAREKKPGIWSILEKSFWDKDTVVTLMVDRVLGGGGRQIEAPKRADERARILNEENSDNSAESRNTGRGARACIKEERSLKRKKKIVLRSFFNVRRETTKYD